MSVEESEPLKTVQSGLVKIVAEIGVNHNGSVELAKELVSRSAAAGADYAKFQTFKAVDVASERAALANYQQKVAKGSRQVDMLSALELSEADFQQLVDFCAEVGVGFLTTAHDLQSARFVLGLASDYVKVASGDITNYPLLRLFSQQGTPVLLSTGASEADEVLRAITVLESGGLERSQITVMQCTSEYPAPVSEANLRAMAVMGTEWGVPVGYSDHTQGINASIAAVAMGATVIEKHITLERTMDGPDHAASLEPREFEQMVKGIRDVSAAMGSDSKRVVASEQSNRSLIRKSIVATVPIVAGDTFSEENLGVMRPGDGVSPMLWESVLGQKASRDFVAQEAITLQ